MATAGHLLRLSARSEVLGRAAARELACRSVDADLVLSAMLNRMGLG